MGVSIRRHSIHKWMTSPDAPADPVRSARRHGRRPGDERAETAPTAGSIVCTQSLGIHLAAAQKENLARRDTGLDERLAGGEHGGAAQAWAFVTDKKLRGGMAEGTEPRMLALTQRHSAIEGMTSGPYRAASREDAALPHSRQHHCAQRAADAAN